MTKSSNKRPPLWSLKKSKKSLAEIEKKRIQNIDEIIVLLEKNWAKEEKEVLRLTKINKEINKELKECKENLFGVEGGGIRKKKSKEKLKKNPRTKRKSRTKKFSRTKKKSTIKYDNEWAKRKGNYVVGKPNKKQLDNRKKMIKKIYTVYEEILTYDKDYPNPDNWRDPPQYCYEDLLITMVKEVTTKLKEYKSFKKTRTKK